MGTSQAHSGELILEARLLAEAISSIFFLLLHFYSPQLLWIAFSLLNQMF